MEWKVAPSYQHMKIKVVNEETHKALVEGKCDRCGGLGFIVARVENNQPIPIPVDGGVCYKCNGSGLESKWVKAYTEDEYVKYEAAQERAKAKRIEAAKRKQEEKLAKSEENRKALLTKWGYDPENPLIWLVGGGSTFEIKDWLKEQGCKFCRELGWYSCKPLDVPEGYGMVSINFMDVYDWYAPSERFEIKDEAKEIAEAALRTLEPESHSEYVGEIKERLRDLCVTLTAVRTFDGYYGTTFIYTFDYNENVLVWMTSSYKEIEVGDEVFLTGTVKEHSEYKGVKQTKMSRCIIKRGEM